MAFEAPEGPPRAQAQPPAQAQLTANLLGRAGQPEDIAAATTFRCSDDASFITGHILDVNGGSAL